MMLTGTPGHKDSDVLRHVLWVRFPHGPSIYMVADTADRMKCDLVIAFKVILYLILVCLANNKLQILIHLYVSEISFISWPRLYLSIYMYKNECLSVCHRRTQKLLDRLL